MDKVPARKQRILARSNAEPQFMS